MKASDSVLTRLVLGLVAGGVILFLAQVTLNPAPLSAATGFACGAVGFLILSANPVPMVSFLASVGVALGAWMHHEAHISGRSPAAPEGLWPHLFSEALIGLAIALLALLVAGLVMRTLEARRR